MVYRVDPTPDTPGRWPMLGEDACQLARSGHLLTGGSAVFQIGRYIKGPAHLIL